MAEPGSFRVLIGKSKERAGGHIRIHGIQLRLRLAENLKILKTNPQKVAATREILPTLIQAGFTPDQIAEADVFLSKYGSEIVSKRRALRWIVGGAAAVGITLPWTLIAVSDYNSPEAVARRKADADAKAAEELKRNQLLERSNTLDNRNSIDSYSGWSFSYLPEISSRRFHLTQSSPPLRSGDTLMMPSRIIGQSPEDTGIVIKDHIRTTDGVQVTRLAVMSGGGINSAPREEWILRTEKLPGFDTSKLVVRKGTAWRIVSIDRARTVGNEKPTFQANIYVPLD